MTGSGFLAIVVLATRIGAGSGGAAVGVVMAARIVPGFFFAAGAGVLIDRMDRKQVMVVTMIARACVVALLPFVDTVLGLVFASFILEIGTLFFTPAKEATVPNLVPADHLATANSLSLAAAYGTFPIASLLFLLLAEGRRVARPVRDPRQPPREPGVGRLLRRGRLLPGRRR